MSGPDYIIHTDSITGREADLAEEEKNESVLLDDTDPTSPAATPSDPAYTQGNQWALSKIKAAGAWDYTTGSRSVLVGVLDSGIQATHPDLTGNVNTSLGRNFTDDAAGLIDPVDHGTHVAGIIGAVGNNNRGISGVCWNVQMVPLRVFKLEMVNGQRRGTGSNSWVARAITYAQDNNIPILNYSGGGGGYSQDLVDAINNYKGLFICAAGNGKDTNNDGYVDTPCNIDNEPFYPASYSRNCENVISVANTQSTDTLAAVSNYGVNSVQIAAPGEGIYSTVPTNLNSSGYAYMSGTSMAAPHVTGVAALVKSYCPNLNASQIKHIILSSVDRPSALNGKVLTRGPSQCTKSHGIRERLRRMDDRPNGERRL